MNKIKSFFIGLFPMIAMGVMVYGIYYQISSGLDLIWLGAILITMPVMLFLGRVMIFKDMARTSAHFPLITSIAFLGLAISIYGYVDSLQNLSTAGLENTFNTVSINISIISFIFYMLYNFWYSSLDRCFNPMLQLGEKLPKFDALDIDGKPIHSSDFEGAATIYLFFRGNWCPLCMAQIKEIADQYRIISDLGARVVLCAPQPEKNTQVLADKFNVPFIFLSDTNGKAADALGIRMQDGLPMGMGMLGYDKDTVHPTVIITDKDGMIIYSDLTNNYRIRPEPEDFIVVLKQLHK